MLTPLHLRVRSIVVGRSRSDWINNSKCTCCMFLYLDLSKLGIGNKIEMLVIDVVPTSSFFDSQTKGS
jgi:hypothetical protein